MDSGFKVSGSGTPSTFIVYTSALSTYVRTLFLSESIVCFLNKYLRLVFTSTPIGEPLLEPGLRGEYNITQVHEPFKGVSLDVARLVEQTFGCPPMQQGRKPTASIEGHYKRKI